MWKFNLEMRKILILTIIILLFFDGLEAQRRNGLIRRKIVTEGYLMISGGPAYCFDDPFGSEFSKSILNGHDWTTSIGYRQSISNTLYLVGLFSLGNYTGADIPSHVHEGDRFLSYNSSIFDFTIRAEYAYKFRAGGKRFTRNLPNTVYGFAGLGLASITVKNQNLSEIPTNLPIGVVVSPPDKPQSIAALIPFGIGYRYDLDTKLTIGAEFGWKFGLTDYLDGYSPPDSKSNDLLGSLSVTLTYRIF